MFYLNEINYCQSGTAYTGRRPGDLQPAADAAQDEYDGSPGEGPALVHVPHEPQLHVALQRRLRRRRDEPARAAEHGDAGRGRESAHHPQTGKFSENTFQIFFAREIWGSFSMANASRFILYLLSAKLH